jgi:hypothetical protein
LSLADRHRRWLLPSLGVAGAGVLWLNLRSAGPDGSPGPAPPKPAGTARAEVAPGPPPTAGTEAKVAELPPPGLREPAPFLLAGRQALAEHQYRPPGSPPLHPDRWRALAHPQGWLPGADLGASLPHEPPPPPDFLIDRGAGWEAWIQGFGYRSGAVLPGGYVLKRVGATGIVVSGPAGSLVIPLDAPAARPPPTPTPTPLPKERS